MLDDGEAPEVGAAFEGQAPPENDDTPTGGSPWEKKAQEFPEFSRPHVLEALKYADSLATPKFQEAAEFRKKFEPFEPYTTVEGLTDWDPAELTQGLDLLQRLMDEEQAPELVRSLAEHYGLQIADDGDDWDEDPDTDAPDLDAKLEERLAPFQQHLEQQQQQERERQANEQIVQSFQAIEKQAGRELDESERNHVLTIAQGLIGKTDDPIRAGWEAVTQIREAAQKGLVAQKRREPGQAEVGPSSPDGSFKASTSFEDAKDEVAAYLRAQAA